MKSDLSSEESVETRGLGLLKVLTLSKVTFLAFSSPLNFGGFAFQWFLGDNRKLTFGASKF